MEIIDPNLLYFGQQHIGTIDFFGNNYHTIHIKDFPHLQALKGDTDKYLKYLDYTWGQNLPRFNTLVNRQKKLDDFKSLCGKIQKNGFTFLKKSINNVRICERFDGKKIIIGGNHRSAIAYHLNLNLPCERVSIEKYISKILQNTIDKFGTKNNMPDQTITIKGQQIIKGRRDDILERFDYIKTSDIVDKTLVDFGCNTGINCLLFIEKGGSYAKGFEISPGLATAAIRLNVLVGYNCHYEIKNLSSIVNSKIKYDTGFVFSVDKHIKNNKNLAINIVQNIKKTVYFETHDNSIMPKEIQNIFKDIVYLGRTFNGKRKIYRCSLQ